MSLQVGWRCQEALLVDVKEIGTVTGMLASYVKVVRYPDWYQRGMGLFGCLAYTNWVGNHGGCLRGRVQIMSFSAARVGDILLCHG